MSEHFPEKIEKTDITPIELKVGETAIILQRHGEYERNTASKGVGSLTDAGIENIRAGGKTFFERTFDAVPKEERKNVDILVIASDTQYEGGGRRSMETGDEILDVVRNELKSRDLDSSQLLNTSSRIHGDDRSRPIAQLREPQMLNDSPEFVAFLRARHGVNTTEFWRAFEADWHSDYREQQSAEGPDDIVDRTKYALQVLARFARMYHRKHPGRRMVIWAATHYDTISPFVKREVFKSVKDAPLGVDYGAGVLVHVDATGGSKVVIAGEKYPLTLEKEGS